MNELEIRLQTNGAFKRGHDYFCSVHNHKLNKDGSCGLCLETESIIGMEMEEAIAMNRAQQVYENDNYFEEDYPNER